MPKIAFNITTLALLRGIIGDHLSLSEMAHLAQKSGAKAIVLKLMKGLPVQEIGREVKRLPLQVEAAPDTPIEKSLGPLSPKLLCFVPGKKEETAPCGGLDLECVAKRIALHLKPLNKKGMKVALSLDPSAQAIREAKRLGVDAIELSAKAYSWASTRSARERAKEDLYVAGHLVRELGLELHLGGGLTYEGVAALAQIPELEFLNMGRAIAARSFLVGLPQAFEELKEAIGEDSLL